MTVGKKYTVAFHRVSNFDGPPWTFTSVLDTFDFSQTFEYEAGFVTTSVVHKYKTNPTMKYGVDQPPATNPDPNNETDIRVVVTFFYTVGTEPNLTTKTIDQMFTDAKTAAGY
jgi:hypothetical protein